MTGHAVSGQIAAGATMPELNGSVPATDWFLSSSERGNAATTLDRRHEHGTPWTDGNHITPLVHGAVYFAELVRCLRDVRSGDLVLFTDWRGDPDQVLEEQGACVSDAFRDAAARGAVVRGLIWRSHLDKLSFSEQENRHLGEAINKAGGECVLDMRVRPGGSHHQKFVVFRHRGRPHLDVAFVGGIDLCHGRRDDARHRGDAQRQPMASVYGERPPWHDIQAAVRGPAVADLETVFRERWEDPTPLTRNPVDVFSELLHRDDRRPDALPPPLPDPALRGTCSVQVLRTAPHRHSPYAFAPDGERSIARGIRKVVSRAKSLIYVENQYLWSAAVIECFAAALRKNSDLRFIAVIPAYPDQDGRWSRPPNLVGLEQAMNALLAAGPGRVAVCSIENDQSVPVYVHAKVCIVDDVWASIGSDNLNRRSWTHDSELSCAVIDDAHDARAPQVLDRYADGARQFARDFRLELAAEHLGRHPGEVDDLADPVRTFDAFVAAADALDTWHRDGGVGAKPPGRLRSHPSPHLSARTRAWARPAYHLIYDPDGRSRSMRRANRY